MAEFDAFAREYSFFLQRNRNRTAEAMAIRFVPADCAWAVDLGCGPGLLAHRLTDLARNVVALDLSMGMLEVAGAKRPPNLSPLLANIERLPFPPGQFDFAVSMAVLHETDLAKTLPAIARLLRPGGRLVVWDLYDSGKKRAETGHVASVLTEFPGSVRQHGWSAAFRLARFMLNPAWIRHNRQQQLPTESEFKAIYQTHLGDCRFIKDDLLMGVMWEAPA